MRYPCLVLDHDDTVVKSTPNVHYHSFQKTLSDLRPNIKMTLEEFVQYCFSPGFSALCYDILQFTQEEMQHQEDNWRMFMRQTIPPYYEGFDRIIAEQKKRGGLVCVVSHSSREFIQRDYLAHFHMLPDRIFDWDLGEEKRKPHPYPLQEILRQYSLHPSELLMVDDLKPGQEMANLCGVDFAAAGWSQRILALAQEMKETSKYYFEDTESLYQFLFAE